MKLIEKQDILVAQPRLGTGFFVTVLITMMAVQWMTVDLYLPALPVLKDQFGVTESLLNLTFNSDILLCAVGTFIGGTISDKYGRNPVILFGLALSGLALLACAFAGNVWTLTLFRGLSGLGGGFALAVSSAIIRDSFRGDTFRRITTFTQAATVIGPVFAPAIGAFLIEYFGWRWIFFFAGGATLLTLVPFFFAKETWPPEMRIVSSVRQASRQALGIAKDRDYLAFIGMVLLLTIPLWAYLAVCSYIYYDDFGVTNMQYTVLYTIGTALSLSGPLVYMFLAARRSSRQIVYVTMAMVAAGAGLFALIGSRSPALFLVAMAPVFLAEGIVRPLSMVVVLERYKDEAGSASAVNGFALMLIGVVAASLATLPWPSFIFGLAVLSALCFLLSVPLWIRGKRFLKE